MSESAGLPAMAYGRESSIELSEIINNLAKRKALKIIDVILNASLADRNDKAAVKRLQERVSRWLHNSSREDNWKILKEDEYLKVQAYLLRHPALRTGDVMKWALFSGAVFHSLSGWFKMSEGAYRELRDEFPGEYAIYRHSNANVGNVLVGRLSIRFDQALRAVVTKEVYKTTPTPGVRPNDSELEGFIFRRNGKYRILSKDRATDELQYIFINEADRGGASHFGRLITYMAGILVDIQLGQPYVTRFVLHRELGKGGVKPESIPFIDLPPTIKAQIGKPITLTEDRFIGSF